MSLKKIIPVLLVIVIIALASSVFLLEKRKVTASICPACDREIHEGWAFTLTFKNGKKETLCCAKCGLLEAQRRKTEFRSAAAKDFYTGKAIESEKAVYVWNSSVDHCSIPEKRDWTNRQPMKLVWDRCIPSLIPFETRDEAVKFQLGNGGTIVDYAEAVQLAQSPSNTLH